MLFDGVAGKFRNAAVFRLDRQRAAALIYGAALCRIVGDGIGVFRLIVEKGSVDDFVDDAAGAVAGIVVYCTALGAYGFGNIAGKRTVFYSVDGAVVINGAAEGGAAAVLTAGSKALLLLKSARMTEISFLLKITPPAALDLSLKAWLFS